MLEHVQLVLKALRKFCPEMDLQRLSELRVSIVRKKILVSWYSWDQFNSINHKSVEFSTPCQGEEGYAAFEELLQVVSPGARGNLTKVVLRLKAGCLPTLIVESECMNLLAAISDKLSQITLKEISNETHRTA